MLNDEMMFSDNEVTYEVLLNARKERNREMGRMLKAGFALLRGNLPLGPRHPRTA